jgi:hypothetical protein
MYDSVAGRFVSRDPIGYRDRANAYVFVHSKPLDYRDPSGLAKGIWNKTCEICRGAWEIGPFDAWGVSGIWDGDVGIGSYAQTYAQEFDSPGESNAARHCYWQAMMTIYYGERAAAAIGDAHEYGEEGNSDSAVDQFNNPIGRRIGHDVANDPKVDRESEVRRRCRDAVEDGTLATSPTHPGVGPWWPSPWDATDGPSSDESSTSEGNGSSSGDWSNGNTSS